jgi:hypothetical protein
MAGGRSSAAPSLDSVTATSVQRRENTSKARNQPSEPSYEVH